MATAHRSPENVLVGKRTRRLYILGLRVGCCVVVLSSGEPGIASVLQDASSKFQALCLVDYLRSPRVAILFVANRPDLALALEPDLDNYTQF